MDLVKNIEAHSDLSAYRENRRGLPARSEFVEFLAKRLEPNLPEGVEQVHLVVSQHQRNVFLLDGELLLGDSQKVPVLGDIHWLPRLDCFRGKIIVDPPIQPETAVRMPSMEGAVAGRTVEVRGGFLDFLKWLLFLPVRVPKNYLEKRVENKAFAAGIDAAWEYCMSNCDSSYVEAWCNLGISTPFRPYPPRTTRLFNRLCAEFPRCDEFYLEQCRSANVVHTCYAIMAISNPHLVPEEVANRDDIATFRDWCWEEDVPVRYWVDWLIRNYDRNESFFGSELHED